MDRRLFVTGLFGVAGAAALTAVVPPGAKALAGVPANDAADQASVLPNLEELKVPADEGEETTPETGEQLAQMYYRRRRRPMYYRRRRRRRIRRWRNYCRRRWWHGRWRRRCYRRPFWIWIGIG